MEPSPPKPPPGYILPLVAVGAVCGALSVWLLFRWLAKKSQADTFTEHTQGWVEGDRSKGNLQLVYRMPPRTLHVPVPDEVLERMSQARARMNAASTQGEVVAALRDVFTLPLWYNRRDPTAVRVLHPRMEGDTAAAHWRQTEACVVSGLRALSYQAEGELVRKLPDALCPRLHGRTKPPVLVRYRPAAPHEATTMAWVDENGAGCDRSWGIMFAFLSISLLWYAYKKSRDPNV